MKHKSYISVLLLLVATGTRAQIAVASGEGDKILGIWQTAVKDGKIEISLSEDRYFGRLVWGKSMFEADGKTSKKDAHNSDEKLRGRTLQNLVILSDFAYHDRVWEDGTIYDPDSSKTYKCVMRLKGGKLNIRGYIGISIFGKTEEWDKVQ